MFGVMERLNYHHLLYFWMVAREGTMARACERLLLAQSTLSAQIAALEDALGEKLFERAGRKLRLTEMGRTVFGYADEIFSLGRELVESVKGRPTGRPLRLMVGVADGVPKLVAYHLPCGWSCTSKAPPNCLPRSRCRSWTWCWPTHPPRPRSGCVPSITCSASAG